MQQTARFGFSKAQRLLTQRSFKQVFDAGRRYQDPLFLLLVIPTDKEIGQEAARLGLAVSKKVARHAVVRNRIKRYIREAFRLQQDDWVGFDLVVVARRASVDASAADITRVLSRMARQHRKSTRASSTLG